jgi:hypothetical protein
VSNAVRAEDPACAHPPFAAHQCAPEDV